MDFNKDANSENSDDNKTDFPSFPNHVLDNEANSNPASNHTAPSNPYQQAPSQYAVPTTNYTSIQVQNDPVHQAAKIRGIKSLIFAALSFFIFYPVGLFIWPLMLAGMGFNIAGVITGKKSSQAQYEGGVAGFWINLVFLVLGTIATAFLGFFWLLVIMSA